MDNQFDVIVGGVGNGGLAVAANTAKAGLKTLLLEKHNIFRVIVKGENGYDVTLKAGGMPTCCTAISTPAAPSPSVTWSSRFRLPALRKKPEPLATLWPDVLYLN